MGRCVVSDDPQGTTGAGVYLYLRTIENGSEDPRARRVLPTLFSQVRLVYDVDTCRTQRDSALRSFSSACGAFQDDPVGTVLVPLFPPEAK
eukprot:3584009-Pleurochrysis_carterae.AAC.1